jgi:phenylacetate-coenzyme A ligase PaaK-like adenylate-forming protein
MKPVSPERIFGVKDHDDFSEIALDIFKYQAEHNKVYSDYIRNLRIDIKSIRTPGEIPFLPIDFFKCHKITTGNATPVMVFESSGTTGLSTGRHYITDTQIYERSYLNAFRLFYGEPSEYLIAALLPSYVERENSSLVYMMTGLIKRSSNQFSGFYLDNAEQMLERISISKKQGKKIILLGVSFALLDIAERYSPDLTGVIVMETGGMKGRRKEMTREELHTALKKGFNLNNIHSEYGMTELLSQSYSKGEGLFFSPPWEKILIRDAYDPLSVIAEAGITGGISVIDLANINSCSFIATADLGRVHKDDSFEVLGRFDSSDIRGCNLLI